MMHILSESSLSVLSCPR